MIGFKGKVKKVKEIDNELEEEEYCKSVEEPEIDNSEFEFELSASAYDSSSSSLLNLPVEIVMHIACYLDIPSVARMLFVCKYFYIVMNRNIFYKQLGLANNISLRYKPKTISLKRWIFTSPKGKKPPHLGFALWKKYHQVVSYYKLIGNQEFRITEVEIEYEEKRRDTDIMDDFYYAHGFTPEQKGSELCVVNFFRILPVKAKHKRKPGHYTSAFRGLKEKGFCYYHHFAAPAQKIQFRARYKNELGVSEWSEKIMGKTGYPK